MAHRQFSMVLQILRGLRRAPDAGASTDGQLLDRFTTQRDEAAFTALLTRYGPMVLGVCRRVLGDTPDAEDAFQATFLVLVRKAGSVGTHMPLGNWLYTVAFNAARKAKAAATRRRRYEVAAPARLSPEQPDHAMIAELRAVLDEELHHLPHKYRAPVVLCYLEGKTNDEAAGQLGWTKGTVSGRLARARDLLRRRLARRGLGADSATVSTLLGGSIATAPVPADLIAATVRTAFAAADGWPLPVTVLAEGVLRAMFLSNIKVATATVLATAVVCVGVGGLTHVVIARGREGPDLASAAPAQKESDGPPRASDKDVAGLQTLLKSRDAGERARAAAALGALGPRARPAVLALIYALKDEDAAVRKQAAIALGRIGPDAQAAMPVLLTSLKDKDPAVAVQAAQAVEKIGLNDLKRRVEFATALGTLGEAAVPLLIPLLKDSEELQVRQAALHSLADMGSKAHAAVPELAKLVLQPPKPNEGQQPVGELAVFALGRIGPGAAAAVPELLTALKAGDERSGPAIAALGEIGPQARAAVPVLLELLKNNRFLDARGLLWAVNRIDPTALGTPLLERLVKEHPDEEVRVLAAGQLLKRNLRPQVMIAALIAALKSEGSDLRQQAAQLLAQVGPPAREAIPLLVAALEDPNTDVRRAAAAALRAIDPEGAGRIAAPKEELPREVRNREELLPYLAARRDAAQKSFEGRFREFLAGRGTLELVFTYAHHWLESELAVHTKPAERVAAYQAHLERMREVEKVNRLRYESGRIPIFDFASSEFHRLEAEIWLAEQKLKQP